MIRFAAIACVLFFVASPLFAQRASDEVAYQRIETQLDATRFETFMYEDADVTDVVKDIARRCRITIVFERKTLEALSDDDRKITLELADIKAANALNILLNQLALKRYFRDGILYIGTQEKAAETTFTRTYDVRDVTNKIRDFPAPKLRLRGNEDGGRVQIRLPEERNEVDTDDIVEIIEDTVDADWGGNASIQVIKGVLVVTATRETHKEVRALIRQLRTTR